MSALDGHGLLAVLVPATPSVLEKACSSLFGEKNSEQVMGRGGEFRKRE